MTESLLPRIVWSRRLLAGAAILFALALLAQVALAGMAVFIGPGYWLRHTAFVHTFEWLAPLAVILAYLGRTTRGIKALAWITVLLLFAQYLTAGFRVRPGMGHFAAAHAVTAMLLFWTSAELARQSAKLIRAQS